MGEGVAYQKLNLLLLKTFCVFKHFFTIEYKLWDWNCVNVPR